MSIEQSSAEAIDSQPASSFWALLRLIYPTINHSELLFLGLFVCLYKTNTLEQQCEPAYEQLMQRDTPIRKNTFIQSLKKQNWTLYCVFLTRHLKELIPVIYTPTERGKVILRLCFSLHWFCISLFRQRPSQIIHTCLEGVKGFISLSRIWIDGGGFFGENTGKSDWFDRLYRFRDNIGH